MQSERMASLWDLVLMMALSLDPEEDTPAHLRKQAIGFMYRDILRARLAMAKASRLVQKVLRGHFGRKEFRRAGKRHSIPLPVPWEAAVAKRRGGAPSKSALKSGKGGQQAPLEDVKILIKGLMLLPEGVYKLTSTPALLRHAASRVSVRLREGVKGDLAAFAAELGRTSELIMQGLRAVGVSEESVGCQVSVWFVQAVHLAFVRFCVSASWGPRAVMCCRWLLGRFIRVSPLCVLRLCAHRTATSPCLSRATQGSRSHACSDRASTTSSGRCASLERPASQARRARRPSRERVGGGVGAAHDTRQASCIHPGAPADSVGRIVGRGEAAAVAETWLWSGARVGGGGRYKGEARQSKGS